MQNFYESFTFIIAFMLLVMIFQFVFGAGFVKYFLMLVLASMAVVNYDKLGSLFKGIEEV